MQLISPKTREEMFSPQVVVFRNIPFDGFSHPDNFCANPAWVDDANHRGPCPIAPDGGYRQSMRGSILDKSVSRLDGLYELYFVKQSDSGHRLQRNNQRAAFLPGGYHRTEQWRLGTGRNVYNGESHERVAAKHERDAAFSDAYKRILCFAIPGDAGRLPGSNEYQSEPLHASARIYNGPYAARRTGELV